MKYKFQMCYRVSLLESAEAKHNQIINSLKKIEPPWGVNPEIEIPFPGFKDIIEVVRLNKYLSNGIKADIIYRYRNKLDGHQGSDDFMNLEFNSKNIDFQYFMDVVLPKYIEMFKPYRAAIYTDEMTLNDIERSRDKNLRKSIIRVYPISFYDEEFCRTVFKLSCKEIVQRLRTHFDQVELFSNGVVIIAGLNNFSIKESDYFDQKVKSLLEYRG